jgi:hypothetical protein
MLRVLLALAAIVTACDARDWYLFTSFRKNGETGVFFALSPDGRKWTALNGNRPWLRPEHAGMLMRDPYLGRGPDGVWHLLWTWGWTRAESGGGLQIGHASSRDLIDWSPQRAIPVLADEPTARNAWAPEAIWDPAARQWIVFWSTTIPGRFPNTDSTGDDGYNHRLYAVTTRDWNTFTPARLWFDAGFNSIDATVVQDGRRWIMIFKDERKNPLQKRLRLAFADSAAGPWRDISEPFTESWVEGPSAIGIGKEPARRGGVLIESQKNRTLPRRVAGGLTGEWWIYVDHYAKPQHYGAVRTRDWKNFEDVSSQVSFPEDHRHGTVVRIPESLARRLRAQSR